MAAISMKKDEYELAMERFETEFQFTNVDTMMHRFPPALRDAMKKKYLYMVEPRVVAIGPYHHHKKHLKKMEEVKNAAAYYLWDGVSIKLEEAMQKVRPVLDKARGKYYLDGTTVNMDDTCFAAMMFRDASFLLLYMDVYERSYGEVEDYTVKPSMRRFLFSNRDCIESDIMLLENQIPWQVIQALVDLAKNHLSHVVEKFIAGMGNSFKITESCDDHSQKNRESCGFCFFKKNKGSSDDPPATYDKLNEENNPPAHLLEVLRRYKTKSEPASRRDKTPAVTSISWMSAMNLEEIGIKLNKATPTATFSDMHLEKGLFLNRHLTLAPLWLRESGASCLVNMAALEICTQSRFGDHGDRNAVCSYLAVLAFLMVGTEDVRRLRSKGLLHGTQSDGDMLAFFNAVAKHLPIGRNLAFLMGEIQEYKEKRPIWTKLYKWVYNHYATIMKVVSVIATVIGLFAAFIAIYKALHKN